MADKENDKSRTTPAAARIARQTEWVNAQIEQAIARGEFDDLPGAGKPIPGLESNHDPDWWLKGLIERERITGVLPPALGLRKDDEKLDAVLDRQAGESEVRTLIDEFNARVINARRQLSGGPPVITPVRDVDDEIEAWRARRDARREANRGSQEHRPRSVENPARRRRRWFRRNNPQ